MGTGDILTFKNAEYGPDSQNIPVPRSSQMIKGSVSLSNTILTLGADTELYAGNGTSQSVVTDIDTIGGVDYSLTLSLWSAGTYNTNDEVYFVRNGRQIRAICLQDGVTSDPSTLYDFTDATFDDWKIESQTNGGMIWIKNRDDVGNHVVLDSIRGFNGIKTNTTDADADYSSSFSSFNNDGFSVSGTSIDINSTNNFVSWTHQTTQITSGRTNHGKPYIREYNPVSGYMQSKYVGSGITGHDIPHGMTNQLDFVNIKNTTTAGTNWVTGNNVYVGDINLATGLSSNTLFQSDNTVLTLTGTGLTYNTSGEEYIVHGFNNSQYDIDGTLQGSYEIGVYSGDGTVGNKIFTRGKPQRLLIVRADVAGDWILIDPALGSNLVYANTNSGEVVGNVVTIENDGFSQLGTTTWNGVGGTYLYFAVYDTGLTGGGAYYDKPSDTAIPQITDAEFVFADGIDGNGLRNSIESIVGTSQATSISLVPGWNWLYRDGTGAFGSTPNEPEFGTDDGFGDVYNLKDNKLYPSTAVFSADFRDGTIGTWTTTNGAYDSRYDGCLKVSGGADSYVWSSDQVNLTKGRYKLKYFHTNNRDAISGTYFRVGTAEGDGTYISDANYPHGHREVEFIIPSDQTVYVSAGQYHSGIICLYDNIAIIPLNDDGSIDFSAAIAYTGSTKRSYWAKVFCDSGNNPVMIEKFNSGDVVEDFTIQGVLKVRATEWLEKDGIPYQDEELRGVPNTSFSPTGARIYPDGTIRGKSSYGEYIKYPNGDIEMSSQVLTTPNTWVAQGSQYYDSVPTWTLPHKAVVINTSGGEDTGSLNVFVFTNPGTGDTIASRAFANVNTFGARSVILFAKGEWK